MADDRKEMFDRRQENAGRRMADNAEIDTLTEEQHKILSWLCKIRHEMHTDQEAFFHSESADHNRFWELLESCDGSDINGRLVSAGLPGLRFPGVDINYNTDATYEDDDLTYDEALDLTMEFLADVNSRIEAYLDQIDKAHGTHYAPTGAYRLL